MKSAFTTLGLFTSTVLAVSRTSAPDGCVTVSKSGGDFSTVQAAVDSDPPCIFLAAGSYDEQVLINQRSSDSFAIYGYTEDDTSFAGNQATITHNLAQANGLSNDQTATLRVKHAGFKLYNVNVVNTYGEGSQAVAISAYADSGYYGVAIKGFQDTLLANQGNQIYVDSQIVGATDFIFGQTAVGWFEGCDIRCLARSIGYVTAHGRDSPDIDSIYVFDSCSVSAADGNSVPNGAYYLGRAWRDYANVVFQKSQLSAVINSLGWRAWNDEQDTSGITYAEYQNTGAGAEGPRVSWAIQLDAPKVISSILPGYESATWFDASYYAGSGAAVGSS